MQKNLNKKKKETQCRTSSEVKKKEKDPKVKKAWKILGYFSGILFDIESILIGIAVFLSTLLYEFNLIMQNESVAFSDIPSMLSVIDGLTAFILFRHIFVLLMAAYTRILSYFAKKRKILSFIANTIYFIVNLTLFIHLDKADKLTYAFGVLGILYLINNGKIIYDFVKGICHVNKRTNSKSK